MSKCPCCNRELKQLDGKVKLAVQLSEEDKDRLANELSDESRRNGEAEDAAYYKKEKKDV